MLLSKIVDAVNAKSFGETNWTYGDIYPYFAQAISEVNGELEDFRRIESAPDISESSPYYSIAAYNALPDTHILNYVVTYITVAMDNAQLAVTSRTQSYATQLAKYKQQLIADLYKWMPLTSNSNNYFDLEHDGRDTRRLPVVGRCWYNEDEGGKLSCNPSSDGNYQTNPSLGVHCENPYGYLVPRDTTQKILKGTYYYDYIFVPYEAFRPYYDPVGVRVAITGYDIQYTSIPYTTIEHLDVKHITNSSGDSISIDDDIDMNNKQISNVELDNVSFSDNDCSLNLDSMHINIGDNILIDKYDDEDSINVRAVADGGTTTSFYMAPNSPVTLSYGNYQLLVDDSLEYKASFNQTLFKVDANQFTVNRGSMHVLESNNNETYLLGYNNNNLYGVLTMTSDEMHIANKSIILETMTSPYNEVRLTSSGFTYNGKDIATKEYVDNSAGGVAITYLEEHSGARIDLEINSSNYQLVAKLYNKNNQLVSTSSVIDLPLESIVTNALYYDTYTYDGTTYTKVIVITLSTTSVPTIVPVGDLVNGLQATLVSGTNIKTINQQSILGSGNITIDALDVTLNEIDDIYDEAFVQAEVSASNSIIQFTNDVITTNGDIITITADSTFAVGNEIYL